jgi:flagellum-specific ATP synthase
VSRLIGDVTPTELRSSGQQLRAALAAYREKEDLIAIGAYQHGNSPLVDATLALRGEIEHYLCQAVDEQSTLAEADAGLHALAQRLGGGELMASSEDEAADSAPELPAGATPPIPTLLLNP